MSRPVWTVARTNEDAPDYQYRVVRRTPDGVVTLSYHDTRAEAQAAAKRANAGLDGAGEVQS